MNKESLELELIVNAKKKQRLEYFLRSAFNQEYGDAIYNELALLATERTELMHQLSETTNEQTTPHKNSPLQILTMFNSPAVQDAIKHLPPLKRFKYMNSLATRQETCGTDVNPASVTL